jgi:tetratricopeptide (TPR) repeat protein
MSQNFVSDDANAICNLAIEECIKAAASQFKNIDLVTRALVYFLEAIELNPADFRPFLGMGILLAGGSQYQESLKYLEKALDRYPKSEEIKSYIEIVNTGLATIKSEKISDELGKKQGKINDLLKMTVKMNIK